MHSSAFSTSWCTESVALYGSTTVSDTLGDGKTENVSIILSGYSSLIFEMSRVPIPDPVPPPSEWQTWNPAFTIKRVKRVIRLFFEERMISMITNIEDYMEILFHTTSDEPSSHLLHNSVIKMTHFAHQFYLKWHFFPSFILRMDEKWDHEFKTYYKYIIAIWFRKIKSKITKEVDIVFSPSWYITNMTSL